VTIQFNLEVNSNFTDQMYNSCIVKKIKKTIFTLNAGNYAPDITEMTYPLIKRFADKINANFFIIDKRKFPSFPPSYEKFQIYELTKKMKNDWNIYIDSEVLVHPDMFDPTNHLHKDTIMHHEIEMASIRWAYDEYFLRDGRNIGSCSWFTVSSDWCTDLWTPLDIPLEKATKNIHPIQDELNTSVTPDELIDNYTLSRNIARFGLKIKTFKDLLIELGNPGNFLWHPSTKITYEKIVATRITLANWGVSDYKGNKIPGWMSYNELVWLYLVARKMNSIVEVGSWKGRSSHALASGCRGKVYLVDDFSQDPQIHPNVEQELRANMSQFKNVEIVKMKSVEAASLFPDNSIDMVFIDAAHDRQSVYNDIQAWYPKCRKLLCGHDYERKSVKLGIQDTNFVPRQEGENIWVIDKTRPNVERY